MKPRPCTRCTHDPGAHLHYRRSRECVFCACPRYRRWVPLSPVEWAALIMIVILVGLVPYWLQADREFGRCLGPSHSYVRAETCAGIIRPARPAQTKGTP